MISIQHVGIYFLSFYESRNVYSEEGWDKIIKKFQEEVAFVVLPDAIRAYIGARQISHFEENPDKTDVSHIVFPNEETLKSLTKENVSDLVKFKLAEGYRPCVIGEKTNIREFDRHNLGNKHYHSLRIHMFQDVILDEILREDLIDVSDRFKDSFVVRHNRSMIIDGKELRRQVAEFERIGFIKLAGIVYERTGVIMNNAWFESIVLPALMNAYPEDLALNTFKFMKLNQETDSRITNKEFAITEADKALVPMAFDLESVLADMYADAYYYTRREMI